MTIFADLTLSQIATIYGVLTGIQTGPKTFNSRAKGIARLEALLAGRNLTEADARRAIGIADPPPATDAPAPEPVAETLTVEPDANGGDDRPDTGEDTGPIPLETASADVATILAGDAVQKACRDGLADYLMHTAGLDAETADRAARRAVDALKLPAPATPRAPRTGTKQDRLVDLLRRPQGATLAQMVEATAWQPHTCRGALAGALKKRLGLTITSEKAEGGERVYKLAATR